MDLLLSAYNPMCRLYIFIYLFIYLFCLNPSLGVTFTIITTLGKWLNLPKT